MLKLLFEFAVYIIAYLSLHAVQEKFLRFQEILLKHTWIRRAYLVFSFAAVYSINIAEVVFQKSKEVINVYRYAWMHDDKDV